MRRATAETTRVEHWVVEAEEVEVEVEAMDKEEEEGDGSGPSSAAGLVLSAVHCSQGGLYQEQLLQLL